jgi:hypothetical protein
MNRSVFTKAMDIYASKFLVTGAMANWLTEFINLGKRGLSLLSKHRVHEKQLK